MKPITAILLAAILLMLPVGPGLITASAAQPVAEAAETLQAPLAAKYPSFSIVSVSRDSTVKIKTYNFPANDKFTVTMGKMGTKGVGGVVIGTTKSGSGGSFTATYTIPSSLHGSYQIAIRLESKTSGYYAYNWFYNNTTGGTPPPPGYSGYPTISILSVIEDKSVTIKGKNFPANDTFEVRMNWMGTKGVGGTLVETIKSGAGGSFEDTYTIPSKYHGAYQIAIRLQSPTSGYYAYNWFYNNTTGGTQPPSPPGYSGYPTFSILSVVRNSSVTIKGKNFPANDTFEVLMNWMGTKGVGGKLVETISSGAGGSFKDTFTIPKAYHGAYQIAIRLQSPTSGYYAYNWFYNNTTP